MPAESYTGELPPLTESEKEIARNIERHIVVLANEIGDRNYKRPKHLKAAADYIHLELEKTGLTCQRIPFEVNDQGFENIALELKGKEKPDEIYVLGAHYDSADCPGANDNGSGVAAVLELSRLLKGKSFSKTIRLVSFPNEEHFFRSVGMGSYFYAAECKKKEENIIGMVSLETIGFYSNEEGSQMFPEGLNQFYPSVGNFIGFVGNFESHDFLNDTISTFRDVAKFPSEGLVAESNFGGIYRSDHSQFWAHGYPAIMITDTADFRYKHYHTPDDTPDKVDFESVARVVSGLADVFSKLAGEVS